MKSKISVSVNNSPKFQSISLQPTQFSTSRTRGKGKKVKNAGKFSLNDKRLSIYEQLNDAFNFLRLNNKLNSDQARYDRLSGEFPFLFDKKFVEEVARYSRMADVPDRPENPPGPGEDSDAPPVPPEARDAPEIPEGPPAQAISEDPPAQPVTEDPHSFEEVTTGRSDRRQPTGETPKPGPQTNPVDSTQEDANKPTTQTKPEQEDSNAPPKPAKEEDEANKTPVSPTAPPTAGALDAKGKPAGKKPGDMPLSDSAILKELVEADERANNAARMIEQVRKQIAEYAKKEEMTDEDIQEMQKKQAELMEMMSEFEDITRRVQHLVGLVDVESNMLGPPQTPMVEGVRTTAPGQPSLPEDTLPKVIVCGTGSVDHVPKIIVCEPTKAGDGRQTTYKQLDGKRSDRQPKATPGRTKPPSTPTPGMSSAGPGAPSQGDMRQMQTMGQMMPMGPVGGFCQMPPAMGYPGGPGMMPPFGQQMYCPPMMQAPIGSMDCSSDKAHEDLKKQLKCLKQELKTKENENQELKTKLATQGAGDTCLKIDVKEGGVCRNVLSQVPICKADVYKSMGLPLPPPGTQPQCPGAQMAAAMGLNENQMCRTELVKSMTGRAGHATGDAPQFLINRPGPGQTAVTCKAQQKTHVDMESIVKSMEQEVRSIQKELELVQAERRGLELQKKLLTCTSAGPGSTPSAGPGSTPSAGPKTMYSFKADQPYAQPFQPKPIGQSTTKECTSTLECQLSSLREQYRKLQQDFNSKVEEVSMVRVEYDAAKRDALSLLQKCEEAEARVDDLLERLKAVENEKFKMASSKDQLLELEQQLVLAKQRYREGQEELDEMRTAAADQMAQLEEYRNKYLTAQQTVEEQRRQLDIMELENNRIGEQVNLEIQRVKTQFKEKIQELTPLPDMLKATQLKLQESHQLRTIAERNVEQMKKELDEVKEKNRTIEIELEEFKKGTTMSAAERADLQFSLSTGERKIEEIKSENVKLRATVSRLEELALNYERRFDEKNHEVLQLSTQLETLREESARQVSRTKDRCETVRRSLQSQISELERQLAQSRAAARTAQKDRDEIRQRMQAQVTSLNENFEQAQMRIRSLQSHVNYLKMSYTNIFAPECVDIPPPSNENAHCQPPTLPKC